MTYFFHFDDTLRGIIEEVVIDPSSLTNPFIIFPKGSFFVNETYGYFNDNKLLRPGVDYLVMSCNEFIKFNDNDEELNQKLSKNYIRNVILLTSSKAKTNVSKWNVAYCGGEETTKVEEYKNYVAECERKALEAGTHNEFISSVQGFGNFIDPTRSQHTSGRLINYKPFKVEEENELGGIGWGKVQNAISELVEVTTTGTDPLLLQAYMCWVKHTLKHLDKVRQTVFDEVKEQVNGMGDVRIQTHQFVYCDTPRDSNRYIEHPNIILRGNAGVNNLSVHGLASGGGDINVVPTGLYQRTALPAAPKKGLKVWFAEDAGNRNTKTDIHYIDAIPRVCIDTSDVPVGMLFRLKVIADKAKQDIVDVVLKANGRVVTYIPTTWFTSTEGLNIVNDTLFAYVTKIETTEPHTMSGDVVMFNNYNYKVEPEVFFDYNPLVAKATFMRTIMLSKEWLDLDLRSNLEFDVLHDDIGIIVKRNNTTYSGQGNTKIMLKVVDTNGVAIDTRYVNPVFKVNEDTYTHHYSHLSLVKIINENRNRTLASLEIVLMNKHSNKVIDFRSVYFKTNTRLNPTLYLIPKDTTTTSVSSSYHLGLRVPSEYNLDLDTITGETKEGVKVKLTKGKFSKDNFFFDFELPPARSDEYKYYQIRLRSTLYGWVTNYVNVHVGDGIRILPFGDAEEITLRAHQVVTATRQTDNHWVYEFNIDYSLLNIPSTTPLDNSQLVRIENLQDNINTIYPEGIFTDGTRLKFTARGLTRDNQFKFRAFSQMDGLFDRIITITENERFGDISLISSVSSPSNQINNESLTIRKGLYVYPSVINNTNYHMVLEYVPESDRIYSYENTGESDLSFIQRDIQLPPRTAVPILSNYAVFNNFERKFDNPDGDMITLPYIVSKHIDGHVDKLPASAYGLFLSIEDEGGWDIKFISMGGRQNYYVFVRSEKDVSEMSLGVGNQTFRIDITNKQTVNGDEYLIVGELKHLPLMNTFDGLKANVIIKSPDNTTRIIRTRID